MSSLSEIHGEITTSSKALPLLMDLIGAWTSLEGSQVVLLPPLLSTITLSFDDTYPDLGRELPKAVLRLAEAFPRHTAGQFSITSQNGRTVAESYRICEGKVYRRTLTEAPERRVMAHRVPARKSSSREVLVTEHDLARLARPRRNGHHKSRNGKNPILKRS